eukprot:332934-Amphidinium_carterae.1
MKYVAPVSEGSSSGIPALMGLSELWKAGCILLLQTKKLMPSLMVLPTGVAEDKIMFPNGTKTVSLETAPSGHLLV